MKKILNERILFLLIFSIFVVMVINAGQKEKKFYVFNSNNGKLYSYLYLKSGDKYALQSVNEDSITVITRLILPPNLTGDYSYNVTHSGQNNVVTRPVRKSGVSRGINGKPVSAWNSYRFHSGNDDKIIVHNTSGHDLIFKINQDSKKAVKSHKKPSEYISYPPDYYDSNIDIIVGEKEYSYYQGATNGISLTLEGPIKLKIINRLIIDDIDKLSFSYTASIDNKEVLYVQDVLPYSSSYLAGNAGGVTQGKVNIIEIPSGIHNIKISDEDPAGIIYSLYISKKDLGK
jgi:hypothetical protein